MTLPRILKKTASFRIPLVEVTGGEPLEQEATPSLLKALVRAGYSVMLETNGAHDVSRVPRAVLKVVDVKCPSSGRSMRNRWSNLCRLTGQDEVKFVISNARDYRYAKAVIRRHRLAGKNLIFSPLWGRMSPSLLASWVLRDRLRVRVQVQLHKVLWGSARRGR